MPVLEMAIAPDQIVEEAIREELPSEVLHLLDVITTAVNHDDQAVLVVTNAKEPSE